MTTESIAILGWGSLIWEGGSEFDAWHEDWRFDGPSLKIEFSRISESRLGALTLVIDPENGSDTVVAYCISRRSMIADAIDDLWKREGRPQNRIGYFHEGKSSKFRDQRSFDAIAAWASTRGIDGVVWTDLQSNFTKKSGKPFNVENALKHLSGLDDEGKSKAEQYLKFAPDFVQTPLRMAWQNSQL